MKIDFQEIPKFVINLDRRTDRLEHIKSEFNHMGWTFERFPAVDTNSYEGCALSHVEISKIILEKGLDYAMVFEDDIFFMPYTKELIGSIENELEGIDFSLFHFAPSIHRPLSKLSENLIDMTNLPPKDPNKHRGIFGTSGFLLTQSSCEFIINWDTNKYIENSHRQMPIDEYMDRCLYPNLKSCTFKYPLITQKDDFSDINKTFDKNHYLMTYNWNAYMPFGLEQKYYDFDFCKKERES